MNEIVKLSLSQLSEKLQNKEISSVEATNAYLRQIEAKDKELDAYLRVTADSALATAKAVDQKRREGANLSSLAGIPAGIKDNICTKGEITSCASKMLENFCPPYDSAVIERFKEIGVVSLGKVNMDEFAMGSTTENSYFKTTKNPRDLSRVPGGSSGGAAAAVGADEAAFTLGSDTGGSIRQPASFCGVVGMKPTYGAVSRYGLIAFASSLDQIGPLTKTVKDSAMVMNELAFYDKRDTTSLNHKWGDFTADIGKDVKGLRIALPKEYFGEGCNKEVAEAIKKAAEKFEKAGAIVEEASLPSLSYALPAYYVISSAEASSNLARFDGVRYGYRTKSYTDMNDLYKNTRSEGFGSEVQRRIMLGSFVLSAGYYDAYYKKALRVRTLVRRDFDKLFATNDIVLAPVAPTTAYPLGEKSGNPLEMYLGDIYTVPVNIAGVPSLSLPCGTDSQGLPIGMQLIGKPFGEKVLYRAGSCFEQEGGC